MKVVLSQIETSSMSALFILIGTSLMVAIGFLIAFIWSVKNGQYDDDYTPSVRMLFDDTLKTQVKNTSKEGKTKNNIFKS